MKHWMGISLVLSVLIMYTVVLGSCGSGGNGGDNDLVELCAVEYDHWTREEPPELVMENLEGIYDLHSFDIDVWIDGVYLGMPISSADFESFSGTLELQGDTITESITVEGETDGSTGTFSVSSSNSYYGTIHVTLVSGEYDLVCAIGTLTICNSECQDVVLMTIQTERECIMVPENQLEDYFSE